MWVLCILFKKRSALVVWLSSTSGVGRGRSRSMGFFWPSFSIYVDGEIPSSCITTFLFELPLLWIRAFLFELPACKLAAVRITFRENHIVFVIDRLWQLCSGDVNWQFAIIGLTYVQTTLSLYTWNRSFEYFTVNVTLVTLLNLVQKRSTTEQRAHWCYQPWQAKTSGITILFFFFVL